MIKEIKIISMDTMIEMGMMIEMDLGVLDGYE